MKDIQTYTHLLYSISGMINKLNETFIPVCKYGCNGADPEIVLYKRR